MQFLAGFGREATSLPFWENVYGFNMSRIGREVAEDSAGIPIVDVIDSSHIVTNTKVLQVCVQCLLLCVHQELLRVESFISSGIGFLIQTMIVIMINY